MLDDESSWDDEGYHFRSNKESIPIEGDVSEEGSVKGEPVVKEEHDFDRMHPDFPETHDYLRKSLSDIEFLSDRIMSMKSEKEGGKVSENKGDNNDDDDEPVEIRKRSNAVDHDVSIDDLRQSPDFQRRKVRNKAKILVKRNLLSKGYSKEFIRENSELIEEKVDEFLFG